METRFCDKSEQIGVDSESGGCILHRGILGLVLKSISMNDGLHPTGKVFNGGKESNAKRSSDDREEKWQAFDLLESISHARDRMLRLYYQQILLLTSGSAASVEYSITYLK